MKRSRLVLLHKALYFKDALKQSTNSLGQSVCLTGGGQYGRAESENLEGWSYRSH